jgi:hypothetical protein
MRKRGLCIAVNLSHERELVIKARRYVPDDNATYWFSVHKPIHRGTIESTWYSVWPSYEQLSTHKMKRIWYPPQIIAILDRNPP